MSKKSWFSSFAKKAAYYTGTPPAFILATLVVIIWVVTGPLFNFSDTWQLVINTGTTIITFLMVFLIQNAQNRDSAAVQLKLDELIRANNTAHNSLMDLEELEVYELERIRKKFQAVAAEARHELRKNKNISDEFSVEDGN